MMRSVIVMCFLAVAYAKPGYNYQPGEHGSSDLSLPIQAGDGGGDASSEVEKEFYTFSAPEGAFDDANGIQKALGSVKQGLRVVFIKGPENKGIEDAALALARQAAQQQTAIYVLKKQSDIGDLANQLRNIGKNANNHPDVHFVKYRTPEDAENAQKVIQSQYDSLGGHSQNINGGVAPVLDFASHGPIRDSTVQAPQSVYLPSSVLKQIRH